MNALPAAFGILMPAPLLEESEEGLALIPKTIGNAVTHSFFVSIVTQKLTSVNGLWPGP